MKRIRAAVVDLGLGILGFYLLFLIPQISGHFPREFVLLVRQVSSLSFGLCVLTNFRGMLDAGESLAPRVLAIANMILDILNVILRRNKKDE